MPLFSKSQTLVGVDIGSTAVKVVCLERARGGLQVRGVGIAEVPQDAIVDKSIMWPSQVAGAIEDACRQATATDEVKIGLAGQAIMTKRLTLPPMPAGKLDDWVYAHLGEHVPASPTTTRCDHHVIHRRHDAIEVALLAVKEVTLEEYTDVVTRAGKKVVRVDTDAFALLRCYQHNHEVDTATPVVLVHIGAVTTSVVLVRDGWPQFWRDVPVGGNAITDAIRKDHLLGYNAAEQLKRGNEADGVSPREVARTVEAAVDSVTQEIVRVVRLTFADHGATLFVSGGSAAVAELEARLARALDCDVAPLQPFGRLAGAFTSTPLQGGPGTYATAVGLALDA